MIVKEARFVAFCNGEGDDAQSEIALGEMRTFLREVERAPADAPVLVERTLYDGVLADVFTIEWVQR